MSLTGRTLNILGRSATRIRSTGLQRLRSEYAEGPGNNMPFQTKNKPRLLATMILYAGVAFSLPFIAVRFQMAKQSNN
ncbi:cytochrome c oxidase subunit 7C, mitochondrial-like [Oculina patagonica]